MPRLTVDAGVLSPRRLIASNHMCRIRALRG